MSFADATPSTWLYTLAFDPGSQLIATCGQSQRVIVRRVSKTAHDTVHEQHRFQHDCVTSCTVFTPSSSRIVYGADRDLGAELFVRDVDTGSILANFKCGDWGGPCAFVPSSEQQLLFHKGALVDIEAGTEEPWSPLLCAEGAKCLDFVEIDSHVRVLGIKNTSAYEKVGLGGMPSLVLYDMKRLANTFKDAAFTYEQLVGLTLRRPDAIADFVTKFPWCVNPQPSDALDARTIIHHCAATGNKMALSKWFSRESLAKYAPAVTRSSPQTALQLAIDRNDKSMVRTLLGAMSDDLNDRSAAHVTAAVKEIALKMPKEMYESLKLLEQSVLATGTLLKALASLQETVVVGSAYHEQTVTLWEKALGRMASRELEGMESKLEDLDGTCTQTTGKRRGQIELAGRVIMLPELAGVFEASPFHAIVENCDAGVFQSKLLQAAVEYKWKNNCFPMLRWVMLHYVLIVVLDSTAIVCAAHKVEPAALTDFLLIMTLVLDTSINMAVEIRQASVQGVLKYLFDVWNWANVGALVCMPLGVCGHFFSNEGLVLNFGALGVVLRWFGGLQLLRAFSMTGALVRMVLVIAHDILPFLAVFFIVLGGSTLFFVINMPTSEAFGYHDKVLGPAWPLFTTFLAILGGYDKDVYETSMSALFFSFLALFAIVMMLNLLIAIMSDSYEKVKEGEAVEAIHEKAKMIVELEDMYPTMHKLHRYLHVLEAAELPASTPNHMAEGISGRVKQELGKLEFELKDVRTQMRTFEQGMSTMSKDLGDRLDALTLLVEKVLAQTTSSPASQTSGIPQPDAVDA